MAIHAKLHPPNPLPTVPIGTSVGIDLSMGEPGFLTANVFLPAIEDIVDALGDAIRAALWATIGPAALALEGTIDEMLSEVKLPDSIGAGLGDCSQISPVHRRCRIRLAGRLRITR